MQEIYLSCEKTVVKFGPVKALLQSVNYVPRSHIEMTSFISFYPDDQVALDAKQHSHLTEAVTYKDRVRFVGNRVLRSFLHIERGLFEQVGPLRITITNVEYLDEGSKLFFEYLCVRLKAADVKLLFGKPEGMPSIAYTLSTREAHIEKIVTTRVRLASQERAFLVTEAQRYLDCGDLWTAEEILWRVAFDGITPEISSMLGLAALLQEHTIEAEYFFNQWRDSGQPIDHALANYTLAMLYARHHPEPLRSNERAAQYLQEGYQILQTITAKDIPHVEYDRILNRNGYALIQYRSGHINEAIIFLKTTIAALSEDEYVARFLKTVSMYNLAQCYTQLGLHEEAIDTYQQLLALDPAYPEYHMELARCYITLHKHHHAVSCLERALELDTAIPETYLLLGFCWREMGDLEKTLQNYSYAYQLEPERPDVCYDYAYALSEHDLYQDCQTTLEKVDLKHASLELQEDIFILLAEARLSRFGVENALETLHLGLEYVSQGTKIQENIALLEANAIP